MSNKTVDNNTTTTEEEFDTVEFLNEMSVRFKQEMERLDREFLGGLGASYDDQIVIIPKHNYDTITDSYVKDMVDRNVKNRRIFVVDDISDIVVLGNEDLENIISRV